MTGSHQYGRRKDGLRDSVAHRPAAQRPSDDVYLTAKQVCGRYGDSSLMWIERRLKKNSDFPKPIKIGSRRLWSLRALLEYERICVRRGRAVE